ncbi:MAG: putative immunity protein [Methanofastidiosum sp.]
MRDKRFVAVHLGGPLTKEYHHELIRWARECSEHVLPLIDRDIDKRLTYALDIAKEWEKEKVTVGEARKAAVGAIAVANESSDPIIVAVARSIGHAVATAHMADHSIGAAEYALKAVKISGKSIEEERKWQDEKLNPNISELILTAREKKN